MKWEQVILARKGDISNPCRGKNIHNSLIDLVSEKLVTEIVSSVKKAKYFSIISDCTPDINDTVKLYLTLRFVDMMENDVKIKVILKKRFLEFSPCTNNYIDKSRATVV